MRLAESGQPSGSAASAHTLQVRELSKHFGHVTANDGLDLDFRSGEVHALLGENGAGKSTLIKILAGLYEPDSGTILLDDEPIRLESGAAARQRGISVVHQESTLVPRLTVLENVVLQEGGLGPISADLGQRLVESGRRLGFTLDPKATVETLTPGDLQRVEIARALMADAQFLFLDEPSSVLSPQEKVTFFNLLSALAEGGLGVVVVTHHIGDAIRHSARLTVLRGGRLVEQCRMPVEGLTEETVVHMMVGDIEFRDQRRSTASMGTEVLRVSGVGGRLDGRPIENMTFTVRAGEVLGVAGVEGDGQRELAAALTGAWVPDHGTVEIDGRRLDDYSTALCAHLVADVPDDQRLGTINEISVWENIGLTELAWRERPTPSTKRRLRKATTELVQEFGIRTGSVNAPVAQLSGGNRRRVLLARELSKKPAVAVLAFATRGLDVRSVEQVKEWTRRLAAAGTAVVFISADLDEVLAVSHRIAVIAHGELCGILDAEEADEHVIGRLMLGGSAEAGVGPVTG
jgi:general nucleoside transport system ATP-binding protein